MELREKVIIAVMWDVENLDEVLTLWVDVRGCILRNLYRKNLQDVHLGWLYRPNEQAESEINCGLSGMPNR